MYKQILFVEYIFGALKGKLTKQKLITITQLYTYHIVFTHRQLK